MRKYFIEKELIDEYAKRATNQKMKIALPIFLSILILMFAFTYASGIYSILMPPLSMLFLILLVVIYFTSFSQIERIAELTSFVFTDESVSILIDKNRLNLLDEFAVSRIENKYGSRLNQTIMYTDIASTTISTNDIVIKSVEYDFFTSNGKITIPKELENYEDIKSEILGNAEKYQLVS